VSSQSEREHIELLLKIASKLASPSSAIVGVVGEEKLLVFFFKLPILLALDLPKDGDSARYPDFKACILTPLAGRLSNLWSIFDALAFGEQSKKSDPSPSESLSSSVNSSLDLAASAIASARSICSRGSSAWEELNKERDFTAGRNRGRKLGLPKLSSRSCLGDLNVMDFIGFNSLDDVLQ
jgi:hypothetical protein